MYPYVRVVSLLPPMFELVRHAEVVGSCPMLSAAWLERLAGLPEAGPRIRTTGDPMPRVATVTVCLVLLTLAAISANDDQWPQFRGVTAGAVADDPTLPDTWSV